MVYLDIINDTKFMERGAIQRPQSRGDELKERQEKSRKDADADGSFFGERCLEKYAGWQACKAGKDRPEFMVEEYKKMFERSLKSTHESIAKMLKTGHADMMIRFFKDSLMRVDIDAFIRGN